MSGIVMPTLWNWLDPFGGKIPEQPIKKHSMVPNYEAMQQRVELRGLDDVDLCQIERHAGDNPAVRVLLDELRFSYRRRW